MKRLIFTIATNGYDEHFSVFIDGHSRLAALVGATHWVANKSPPWGISAHQSSWLKIGLCMVAFAKGYEQIAFLDADCEVRVMESPFECFDRSEGNVFMCHDFSNRLNCGLILAKRSSGALRLLLKVALGSLLPSFLLPRGDRNAYENGHVIYFWKREPDVHIIDSKWNWTTEEGSEKATIRHYGGWQARPAEKRESLSWSRWHRRLVELFTCPLLLMNTLYYFGRLPRPEQREAYLSNVS